MARAITSKKKLVLIHFLLLDIRVPLYYYRKHHIFFVSYSILAMYLASISFVAYYNTVHYETRIGLFSPPSAAERKEKVGITCPPDSVPLLLATVEKPIFGTISAQMTSKTSIAGKVG